MENKKELISKMFEKGILLNEDILNDQLKLSQNILLKNIETEEDLIVLNSDYAEIINQQSTLVDWYNIDKSRVNLEKDCNKESYELELQELKRTKSIIDNLNQNNEKQKNIDLKKVDLKNKTNLEKTKSNLNNNIINENTNKNINQNKVNIIISYNNIPHKYQIKDFTNIFRSRYKFLEKILCKRQELQGMTTINRLLTKKEKENVSLIGLVDDINTTKNGHLIITLEDLTGKIKILISKNNKKLIEEAKDLVFDEVIGINGVSGDKIIFAEKIVWPDIPTTNEMKKSNVDEAAIFLSDFHVGSNYFLKKEMKKFLQWINGHVGNDEQKKLAKKVKYILIAGDIVAGIGTYPTQEDDLEITDITDQFIAFTNIIKQIPVDKQIIICPGNHDMVHLAEPQPIFYKEYAETLFNLPNVHLVTNPSLVNIGKTDNFSGFDILLYHGFSFDYYVANVESIRNNGGYHRADLIMKFLLKRRHLAPSFKSTPYYPGYQEDPLLIKTIPDFFLTGHIHYSKVANYKGITLISGSCWEDKTDFQEKLGHEPEPARVPLVELKTRNVKILKFI